jgi:hypothetical protein
MPITEWNDPVYELVLNKINEFYFYTYKQDKIKKEQDVNAAYGALFQEYSSNGNRNTNFYAWAMARLAQDPTNPTVQTIKMRLAIRGE